MKELGSHIGVAESTVSLWETGKREIDTEMLVKLATFFNVSTDELIGLEPKKGAVSDDELKFALFGGDKEITDAQFEEVKKFAQFLKERGEL